MFIYQAVLPTVPAAVLSIRALPVRRRRGWQLGGELPSTAFRIIIRYALDDGCVRTHRGLLRTAAPPGHRLRVASWQVDGAQVLVTLAVPGRPRQRRSRRCVIDRFCLPLSFQAWGITSLEEAAVHVQATARGQRDALQICGTLTVLLRTPAAVLRIRRPFARLLAEAGAEELSWRAGGGASRLHLRVHPGGRIAGNVELAFYYEGRPPGAPSGVDPGGILQVRDLQGAIKAVRAEALSAGFVLVQGIAALDVYWIDQGHRSRWTGRDVPFSGVARLDAGEAGNPLGADEGGNRLPLGVGDRLRILEEGDRLEAQAEVTRIRPLPRQGPGWAAMLISAVVTQFRTSHVKLGQGRYRLEEVVGQGKVTVERIVQWADPDCLAGTHHQTKVMTDLQLPGLWQGLEVSLTGRALPDDQWKVQARLAVVPEHAGWIGVGPGKASDAGGSTIERAAFGASTEAAAGLRASVDPQAPADAENLLGGAESTPDGMAVQRLSSVWGGELPPGVGQGTVVLPWLIRVGPGGVETHAALPTGCDEETSAVWRPGRNTAGIRAALAGDCRGGPGAVATGGPSERCVQPASHVAQFHLPGPVRWILAVQAAGEESARVQVLVTGPGGARLVNCRLPASVQAKLLTALLVYPVEREGAWQLMVEWTDTVARQGR